MSKSQKPRTPEWFPKMKIRGRKRRMLAPYHRTARAFRIIGEQAQMTAGQIAMMKFMFKGHPVLTVNEIRSGLDIDRSAVQAAKDRGAVTTTEWTSHE